jgi:hypothetical protein
LRYHFQFINEKLLFKEIHHENAFGINVYGKILPKSQIHFDSISNLVAPETIDESYQNDGNGIAEGLKDNNGNWSIKGHKDRIVKYSYKLAELEDKHHQFYEVSLFSALERAEKIKETEKIFAELVNWVHDTLEIENNPYIRVIAVLKGVQQ